jgi:hypothetical protein
MQAIDSLTKVSSLAVIIATLQRCCEFRGKNKRHLEGRSGYQYGTSKLIKMLEEDQK